MNGRVHPYALAWEVEQRDGLESGAGGILLYTMPALIIRDQGYQPVLPRLFASMDSFPVSRPSFPSPASSLAPATPATTGPSARSGRHPAEVLRLPPAFDLYHPGSLTRSSQGFHPFQVFVIFPIRANPWAILCKKMAERRDSQFHTNISFTCTGKVAGLLDHRVMVHQPSSDRDYIFIVVPDSWTFLDKTATTAAASALALTSPPKRQPSSASAAFQDARAASFSVATPGALPPSPPPSASTSASADPVTPLQKRPCPEPADTPTKKPRLLQLASKPSSSAATGSSATQSFSFRCLFFLRAGDDETESCLGNRLGTRR
ncbi:hypothetical protein HRG_008555 [Hirsutella rhossiliensis]|uniref:Uncharacterized protein n=1 Tax=Hirsutella rhossiliensis TaxID=111463 RepID=A0A9P8MSC8_9HYPO|nr:uncharacterized protein HRG_08555 [Hirsutella rhossiliensis]KAH0960400.1 hypothetical protein HRG_08555 [Hirsutella rhossiliensis]